jgi:hypothetical protein
VNGPEDGGTSVMKIENGLKVELGLDVLNDRAAKRRGVGRGETGEGAGVEREHVALRRARLAIKVEVDRPQLLRPGDRRHAERNDAGGDDPLEQIRRAHSSHSPPGSPYHCPPECQKAATVFRQTGAPGWRTGR